MAKSLSADRKAFFRKVRHEVKRSGLDAVMVSSDAGIRYLSGFPCEGAFMLVPAASKPAYFVDSMNFTLAERTLGNAGIGLIKASGDKLAYLKDILKTEKLRRLGIEEETLSVAAFSRLKHVLKGIKFENASQILRGCRVIKSAGEIRILRMAAAETVSIWRSVSRKIRPGMSERQVAALVDTAVRARGYENSFPTIAASGPNSAFPHAVPTDRVLKRGEHLLLDFGIRIDGYCSDLTRVWGNGRIMRKFRLIQKHVEYVQGYIINKIRSGVSISYLADAANTYLQKQGLGKFTCHGLGHGVGLEIHEAPSISPRNTAQKLKTGMVITVEPGLYIPGEGGYRVEDMVLVKDRGCEVLTQ